MQNCEESMKTGGINILRIITSMNPAGGGPSQGIRNSIPALQNLGVHNEVVCLDAPDAEFIGQDNFTIHALGSSKGYWAKSNALIPWLKVNLYRFDAIICHGLWQYQTYAVHKYIRQVEKAAANKAIPLVLVMPHGMLDPYFQKAKGRKIKAIRNWIYWKLIESKVINNADGVLFTCQAELLLASQPFVPYHPRRVLNVGYGIPSPPPFTKEMQEAFLQKCPQVAGKSYLLFLSRIHEKKGVDILIKAYEALLQNTGKLCLVIAGPGLDTLYGRQLVQLVMQHKVLSDRVFFPGMLGGNAKWGAFHGCEAFVLPSHQENFGIAVVEALACAKPVLISNQVNIWKEIIDENGGLVASNTEEGTYKLLENWMQMPDIEKMKMAENAKNVYQKYFAIEPAAQKLKNTITDLLVEIKRANHA